MLTAEMRLILLYAPLWSVLVVIMSEEPDSDTFIQV